ncbi:MAG: hypothetical protein R6X25_15675 [Candidatus Krumholzibacteriia bacterium]
MSPGPGTSGTGFKMWGVVLGVILATLLIVLLVVAAFRDLDGDDGRLDLPAADGRLDLPAEGRDSSLVDEAVVPAPADEGAGESPASRRPAPLQETEESVEYLSREGGFAVIFPTGCSRLRTRVPEGAPSMDEFPGRQPTMLEVLCRRHGSTREVAWVAGMYNETTERGTPPDPPMVVRQLQATLERYSVRVEEQRVVGRGPLEGVEVKARRPGPDHGELWLRGVLAGPHFYVLAAWKEQGGLFDDPEYARFFSSFRILAYEEH